MAETDWTAVIAVIIIAIEVKEEAMAETDWTAVITIIVIGIKRIIEKR